MATRMQQRRGTAAQWTSADPILAAGEIGFETDTGKFKIGDGTSVWSSLSYFTDSQDFDTTNFVLTSSLATPNGIATLNGDGNIPISQLGALIANAPSTLDTLEELATYVTDLDAIVDAHAALETNIHGIADTSALETQTGAQDKADAAQAAAEATASADATAKANAAQLAAETTASTALTAHNTDTTDVHGIANTSVLETQTGAQTKADAAQAAAESTASTALAAHNSATAVHGIADTSALETQTGAQDKADAAQAAAEATASADATAKANAAQLAAETTASTALTAHNTDTSNVHGIADTTAIVLTDDSRLSDERTPSDASVTDAKIDGTLSQSSITNLTTDLAAKAPIESPSFTGTVVLPTVTAGGSIVPSTDNTYDLGSPTKMWKDLYVGPGSLYVNGQKVLQDDSGNIVVSADADENLSLRTSGSGNVELDPTGTGNIQIKGPVSIQAGSNITSSDGNAIIFGNAINTDSISSKTENTDLSLSGNGTGKVYLNDNAEVSGNLVVGGNLTVSGTTTTVNSETISLADNIIDLNSNFTTGTPTENAGVRIMRGDSANVQVRWNESTDKWEFTNDGTNYSAIAPVESPTFTGTVSGITKSMVGLENVDNTSDANKPISTATQAALDLKASVTDIANATYYSFNAQTASYSLSLSDSTNMVTVNSSSATTVTVPPNSSVAFPVGTYIDIFQLGTGQVTIVEGSGVTIYATPGKKLRTQYSGASLVKRDTNTWYLTGDIVA